MPRSRIKTPETLVEKAAEKIRNQILLGKYQTRVFLKESVLVRDLKVGRTPVRQALQLLRQEGLVRVDADRGMVVDDPGTRLRQLFLLRFSLEHLVTWKLCRLPEAERTAALKTVDAILEQTDALTRLETTDESRLELVHKDTQFHGALATAAGFEDVVPFLKEIQLKTILAIPSIREPSRSRQIYEEHRRIAEEIGKGDGPRSLVAIYDHLIGSTKRWFPWLSRELEMELDEYVQDLKSALKSRAAARKGG